MVVRSRHSTVPITASMPKCQTARSSAGASERVINARTAFSSKVRKLLAEEEKSPIARPSFAAGLRVASHHARARGMRRDEALERLEQYLEDASLTGLAQARIVHGKGTGAIRQAVRETLRRSPHVTRFAPEPDPSGGDGATQVWLQ